METKTEIIFLGTGTSIGVPVIGCDCEVCLSEDPKNKRLRSSLFVTTPEVRFVVDTGPDFRQQCLREGIRHLDAALFTHAHSDHVMGFDDLRRFTVREHEELPIFANGECLDRLEAAFPYIFDGENRYRGYLKIAPHRISEPFPLGDLLVTPLPVIHGKVETNGFLFSRNDQKMFAYIPDAKILTAETKSHLAGIDLLVLENARANFAAAGGPGLGRLENLPVNDETISSLSFRLEDHSALVSDTSAGANPLSLVLTHPLDGLESLP